MSFFELCIRRPVLATVLSLIVLLLGLVSYGRLSVREYPRIDEPVVSVTTLYRGASAEVVESQVTKPLEDSLSGIEGIEDSLHLRASLGRHVDWERGASDPEPRPRQPPGASGDQEIFVV